MSSEEKYAWWAVVIFAITMGLSIYIGFISGLGDAGA